MAEMNINVFADTVSEEAYARDTVTPELRTMANALQNEGAINSYEVKFRSEDYPSDYVFASGDTKSEIRNDFQDWVKNEKNYTTDGSYLLVDNDVGGGLADYRSAWSSIACSVACGSSGDFCRNIALQEVLHTFIYEYNSDVEPMVDDDEHDLGKINAYTYSTPMTTSYEGKHAQHGDCDGYSKSHWSGDYTRDMTDCTIDGVGYTNPNNNYSG